MLINGLPTPNQVPARPMPGDYGRTAAQNVQNMLLRDPRTLAQADIEYTPLGTLNLDDAFAMSEKTIDQFGHGKNYLDRNDVAGIFGDEKTGDQFMRALDTNGDGKIDAVEETAHILYQDDSVRQTVSELASATKAGYVSDSAVKQILTQLQYFFPNANSRPDGILTNTEQRFADHFTKGIPSLVNSISSQLQLSLNLPAQYQDYLARKQASQVLH